MRCKNCDSNFRTINIPTNVDRVCYKCKFNNGKEEDDNPTQLNKDTSSKQSLGESEVSNNQQQVKGSEATSVSLAEQIDESVLSNNPKLLERFADLEHQQWSHLMKFFLGLDVKTISKNVLKWNNQANTDYKDLSEEDKEKDRVWARKVLEVLKDEAS